MIELRHLPPKDALFHIKSGLKTIKVQNVTGTARHKMTKVTCKRQKVYSGILSGK